jgi:hypothetical protein
VTKLTQQLKPRSWNRTHWARPAVYVVRQAALSAPRSQLFAFLCLQVAVAELKDPCELDLGEHDQVHQVQLKCVFKLIYDLL